MCVCVTFFLMALFRERETLCLGFRDPKCIVFRVLNWFVVGEGGLRSLYEVIQRLTFMGYHRCVDILYGD